MNMFSNKECTESHRTVLLGAHELLLDNEASVSIFKDSALLNNVRDSKRPINMGGIQIGSPSLRVTRQGEFRDFGTVHTISMQQQILSPLRKWWILVVECNIVRRVMPFG